MLFCYFVHYVILFCLFASAAGGQASWMWRRLLHRRRNMSETWLQPVPKTFSKKESMAKYIHLQQNNLKQKKKKKKKKKKKNPYKYSR